MEIRFALKSFKLQRFVVPSVEDVLGFSTNRRSKSDGFCETPVPGPSEAAKKDGGLYKVGLENGYKWGEHNSYK